MIIVLGQDVFFKTAHISVVNGGNPLMGISSSKQLYGALTISSPVMFQTKH